MKIVENLLTPGKKNRPGYKIRELRALVIHWVEKANQHPLDTRLYWERGDVYGSAHYVIGTDGAGIQTLPEDEVGYHVGSTRIDPASGRIYTDKARALFGENVCDTAMNNYYSIGIELEHLNMVPGDFSEATLETAAELCAGILKRHNKTTDILTTHHEIVGWKDCPRLWTNNPSLFEAFKLRVKIKLLEVSND
jgi:N-acetylmuramoyl-L-alanine amidase